MFLCLYIGYMICRKKRRMSKDLKVTHHMHKIFCNEFPTGRRYSPRILVNKLTRDLDLRTVRLGWFILHSNEYSNTLINQTILGTTTQVLTIMAVVSFLSKMIMQHKISLLSITSNKIPSILLIVNINIFTI